MAFGALSFAVLAGPVAHLTGTPEITPAEVPIGLAVGCVAGLLPDIDAPGALLSTGGWMPRRMGAALRFLARIVSLPFLIVGFFIKGALGHRGGTHSIALGVVFTLAFAIPVTLLLGTSGDWLIWTIAFGFASHLIADMLNPSGVPLLWPLRSKHRTTHLLPKPVRIPTESPPNLRENGVRMMVVLATVLLVGFYYVLVPLGDKVGWGF